MNFLKPFIFIIFILLLTTNAINIFPKHKSSDKWREKNPTSRKIKDLAVKSVDYYNREHGSRFSIECVLAAGKRYVHHLIEYFLKILATTRCGIYGDTCSEILYANVYDNGTRFNHKFNFSVDTNGTTPIF